MSSSTSDSDYLILQAKMDLPAGTDSNPLKYYEISNPFGKFPLRLMSFETHHRMVQSVKGYSTANGKSYAEHLLFEMAGFLPPEAVKLVMVHLRSDQTSAEVLAVLDRYKLPYVVGGDDGRFRPDSGFKSLPFWGHVLYLIKTHGYKLADG